MCAATDTPPHCLWKDAMSLSDQSVDVRSLLQSMPVLNGIGSASMRVIAQAAEVRRYMPRDEVFGLGSTPTGLFFVVAGCVQLMTPSAEGRKRVVELFEPGEMFGEIGVLRQKPFHMCALAADPTMLIHVDRKTVLAVLDYDMVLTRRLLDSMAFRTRRLIDSIGVSAPVSVDARVAAYLLERLETRGSCEGPILLPAPKATIASMLNTSPESFSRSLRRLIDMGLVRIGGRRVHVLDRMKLVTVAQRAAAD